MEKGIELLQTALYRAKMGDMSVYQNGDNPIAELPTKYLLNGIISIPNNELLLIEDGIDGERFGKTYHDVFEILVNWYVISDMNLSQEEMKSLLSWFESFGVNVKK